MKGQQIIATEKVLCYTPVLRERCVIHHQGPRGEVLVFGQEVKEWEEDVSKGLFCIFSRKELERQV